MSDLAMKVLKWQSTGDVGISSATLASIACGLKKTIYGHHFGAPHDAADFRRCVALVEQIPEIRDSFDKVAKRVPAFKGILNEWDSLVALLKSEMKIHGNKAPETTEELASYARTNHSLTLNEACSFLKISRPTIAGSMRLFLRVIAETLRCT